MTRVLRRASAVGALAALALAVAAESAVGASAAVLLLAGLYQTADAERSPSHELLTLGGTGVVLLALVPTLGLPVPIAVGALLLAAYSRALGDRDAGQLLVLTCIGGSAVATAGILATLSLLGEPVGAVVPAVVVIATCGACVTALIGVRRTAYRDSLVLATVGGTLWLLWLIVPPITGVEAAVALGVTAGVGYLSFVLNTASADGMLTGVLLALVAIVLGGPAWFVALVAFFGVGGLATKYRYEEKAARGVAERNDGARGMENVLGNAGVAMVAVLGYAAATAGVMDVDPTLLALAFAGALATATADTLSSEIGSVFDGTRLITTLEPVQPGTDGGVTWQGMVAGGVGSGLIAAIVVATFPTVTIAGGAIVLLAGIAGMLLDSVVGATLEGRLLDNQGVNAVATLGGAIVAAAGVL